MYSVCGKVESMDDEGEKKVSRLIPLILKQVEFVEETDCRAGLCDESAESQRRYRGRPAPLLGPRSRKVTKDQGLSFWVPGAHRSPTERTLTPPPRTPTPLSSCDRHGKVDTRNVDMTCDRCRTIFLEESTVPPRSDLGKGRWVPAYCSSLYAFAASGKCFCRPLRSLFCVPCKTRAQISAETAGHIGSTWDWV